MKMHETVEIEPELFSFLDRRFSGIESELDAHAVLLYNIHSAIQQILASQGEKETRKNLENLSGPIIGSQDTVTSNEFTLRSGIKEQQPINIEKPIDTVKPRKKQTPSFGTIDHFLKVGAQNEKSPLRDQKKAEENQRKASPKPRPETMQASQHGSRKNSSCAESNENTIKGCENRRIILSSTPLRVEARFKPNNIRSLVTPRGEPVRIAEAGRIRANSPRTPKSRKLKFLEHVYSAKLGGQAKPHRPREHLTHLLSKKTETNSPTKRCLGLVAEFEENMGQEISLSSKAIVQEKFSGPVELDSRNSSLFQNYSCKVQPTQRILLRGRTLLLDNLMSRLELFS